jgi:translation initiation factor IF-1
MSALAGTVTEILPSGLYRVRLDDGPPVVAHSARGIERNFLRVLVGDRVRPSSHRWIAAGAGSSRS